MDKTVPTVHITHDVSIEPIFYQDQPVLTLAMIDRVHARPEGTARRNFATNKSRLIDGEDFYLIDFAKKNEIRSFGIEVPPRGLILLTESGYLMLVKSFTDDLAWTVQRQLVKGYFRAKVTEQPAPATEYITSAHYHLIRQRIGELAYGFWFTSAAEHALWKTLRQQFGLHRAAEMPIQYFDQAIALLDALADRKQKAWDAKCQFETRLVKWLTGHEVEPPISPKLADIDCQPELLPH